MQQKLIIIRGNSGSGKSSAAEKLQRAMGYGTMLIPQDVVRREILMVRDTDHNHSIQLIYDMAMYGKSLGYSVILEGILVKKRYSDMLRKLIADFDSHACVYYFDIPFDETLRRHNLKPVAHEFGETEMRQWWNDDDRLGLEYEKIITEDMSQNQIVEMIKSDCDRITV